MNNMWLLSFNECHFELKQLQQQNVDDGCNKLYCNLISGVRQGYYVTLTYDVHQSMSIHCFHFYAVQKWRHDKKRQRSSKLSKWFCSMMLWLHLAGDRVNMGCNDILMLVAAPVSGSRWLVPVSRDVGTHSGTGIAASETRAVSRDWALNMRQRPPYTPDTQVHYTWSWLLLSF